MKTKFLLLIIASFFHSTLFAQTTITYTEDLSDFANPERGFYQYSSSKDGTLDATYLASLRTLHTFSTDANFQVINSLVYRYYFLNDFKTSPISSTYLNNMQIDFDAARTAGIKLVIRFAYTESVDNTNCANGICPPYGDASKQQVLDHISQVTNVLQNNKDVLAAVQMGFIGIWGENYYTDYFGDASQSPYTIEANDWVNRNEVLGALLAAVPVERMVQVRYPQMKQKYLYGTSATTSSAGMTAAQAYDGTDISRLGFHNDCFLASTDDFGTFTNYGPGSSNSDTTNLKPYLANDGNFTVVGGETCFENPTRSLCVSEGGEADEELRRFHYSYLNTNYQLDLLNSWVGQCMEEVKRNLGYRFVLQNSTVTDVLQPGQTMNITINIENKGYAAPYNQRDVSLILKSNFNGAIYSVDLNDDPRFWDSGTHSIQVSPCLPMNMSYGTYSLYLKLGDPEPLLADRPEYAIRLANQNIWDATTGYNNLGHTITIDNSASNPACSGSLVFSLIDDLLPIAVVSFYGEVLNENAIRCHWTSSTEEDIEGFFVQRSLDAINFNDLAFVDGQGGDDVGFTYTYDDLTASANTLYYYRLKQVDAIGNFSYSNIIAISTESSSQNTQVAPINKIEVYPNPTMDQININLNLAKTGRVDIQLYNLLGQLIREENIDIKEYQYLHMMNLNRLENGSYILLIKRKGTILHNEVVLKF